MNILDALERLETAATPGPWLDDFMVATRQDGGWLLEATHSVNGEINARREANVSLTVVMRNALPALIECARALEWYADSENHYFKYPPQTMSNVVRDAGQRAREALAKLKAGET